MVLQMDLSYNSGMKNKYPDFASLRKSLKLTQRQIAQALDVTDQTISNWERGISRPQLTLEQTQKLCDLTKLTLPQLIKVFSHEN